ncbi:hypothetical protein [Agromyces bauzanensis]|uniref:hypothetical protein n=1 Tax=Agromyces bauzanensis TaxID=1308924 RepID=UPI00166844D4|nr:hypothetical protein [Agromyces bauzanensis]
MDANRDHGRADGTRAVVALSATGPALPSPSPSHEHVVADEAGGALVREISRAAGNRAAAAWVQRQERPGVGQPDEDLGKARESGRWTDVAKILNGMPDAQLRDRVAPGVLPPAERDRLRAAIPDWAHRVRGAVLTLDYNEAVAARDWQKAAVTVNGFDDAGIRDRMAALDPAVVTDFYNGAAAAMSGVSLTRVLNGLRDRYQQTTSEPLGTRTMTVVSMMRAAGVDASVALSYVRLKLGIVPASAGEKENQSVEDVAQDLSRALSAVMTQPPQLLAGNLAHSLIGGVYVAANAPWAFYDLPVLAYAAQLANRFKATGTTKDLLMNLDMRPDIVDLARLEVYEIKPASSRALAVAEMREYIDLMDGILKQSVFRPGNRWNPGATGALPFTDQGKDGVLVWGCPVPGAILYRFLPKEEEPSAQRARQALHEPESEYEASVAAAAAVAVPLVIVGAGALAALAEYEALMTMLGTALRFAGQALPRVAGAAAAGAR